MVARHRSQRVVASRASGSGRPASTGVHDVGAQGAVLAAITQFLHEHLLMWAPEFARLTIAAAQTPLYRAVGELLAGALGWLAELLPDQG